jgi:hypothetical protein
VAAFAVGGTLLGSLLHPARVTHGIAHAALFTSAVLLAVLGWGVLSRAPRWAAVLVCGGMVVEFLAMFWSHVRLLRDPPRIDPYWINTEIKRVEGLAFLADVLGVGAWPAAAVQLVLLAALVWVVTRRPEGGG